MRWAYPNNRVSDWGFAEAASGWQDAFDAYRGRNPRWTFHPEVFTPVSDREVLAVFWVTFALDGQETSEINLFVEIFRQTHAGWELLRSSVESSISRRLVEGSAVRP